MICIKLIIIFISKFYLLQRVLTQVQMADNPSNDGLSEADRIKGNYKAD